MALRTRLCKALAVGSLAALSGRRIKSWAGAQRQPAFPGKVALSFEGGCGRPGNDTGLPRQRAVPRHEEKRILTAPHELSRLLAPADIGFHLEHHPIKRNRLIG